MKKRYDFMDVLRLLSMAGIVYYHMIVTLYLKGIRQLDSVSVLFQNSNMHVAKVCVGLFFMMSGAGLMLSVKDSENFSLKEYYKKRFFKILVPFYIVYILYLVTFICLTGEKLSAIYDRKVYPVCIIFTLLGMDSYLGSFGVPTYALGIGEWFLGALVMMYIIFPLLRWALLKNKWITLGLATVYYAVILITYPNMSYALTNPGYVNFTVKVFDFFLGMFLVLILDKIPKRSSFAVSACVFLFFLLYPEPLPINDSIMIVLQILSIFLMFNALEGFFTRFPRTMKVIKVLCSYTYIFFLVHHVIIDYMTLQVVGLPYTNADILRLFFFEFLVISIVTFVIKKLTELPSFIKKKRAAQ
ncbi:MAG: acyltransferase [Lachnospiraceae bacterium]|nr:acyltransferase [Lachnospiraceae bacterium]